MVTYLDGLGIKLQTLLLVGQELLDILALISLELNHLAHLRVVDDGAIAGKLLLDDLKDLLLVKLLGQTLDRGQRLASIALCCSCQLCLALTSHARNLHGWASNMDRLTLNTDMNVVLRLLSLSCILIGFGEGVCDVDKSVVFFFCINVTTVSLNHTRSVCVVAVVS